MKRLRPRSWGGEGGGRVEAKKGQGRAQYLACSALGVGVLLPRFHPPGPSGAWEVRRCGPRCGEHKRRCSCCSRARARPCRGGGRMRWDDGTVWSSPTSVRWLICSDNEPGLGVGVNGQPHLRPALVVERERAPHAAPHGARAEVMVVRPPAVLGTAPVVPRAEIGVLSVGVVTAPLGREAGGGGSWQCCKPHPDHSINPRTSSPLWACSLCCQAREQERW